VFKSPSESLNQNPSKSWLGIAVALLIFATVFRVFRAVAWPELPNFSPVMAIAICGAWFLPGVLAFVLPLAALIISDIALSAVLGATPGAGDLLRYACFLGAAFLGWSLQKKNVGSWALILGVLGSAIGFYLITNTAAWFGSSLYSQSLEGWIQALTVGLPGYPPTWTFFRNSIVSDLLFTGLMLGAASLRRSPMPVRA
jgi:hypothetical protein